MNINKSNDCIYSGLFKIIPKKTDGENFSFIGKNILHIEEILSAPLRRFVEEYNESVVISNTKEDNIKTEKYGNKDKEEIIDALITIVKICCPNIGEFNPKELVIYYLKYILEFVIPLARYLGEESIDIARISSVDFVINDWCKENLASGAYVWDDNSIFFAESNFSSISYSVFFHEMSHCLSLFPSGAYNEYFTQYLSYKFAGGRKGYYVEEDYEFMCQLEAKVGIKVMLSAYIKRDIKIVIYELIIILLKKYNINIEPKEIEPLVYLVARPHCPSDNYQFHMRQLLENAGYSSDIITDDTQSIFRIVKAIFEHMVQSYRWLDFATALRINTKGDQETENKINEYIEHYKSALNSACECLNKIPDLPDLERENPSNGYTIIKNSDGIFEFAAVKPLVDPPVDTPVDTPQRK